MMNEKDRTDQINARMMADQAPVNAYIKDLRGLGGTRTVVSYTDIVMNAHSAVMDVCDDNKCEYSTNLSLFLEGLEEDINELHYGCEVRNLPIQPKTTDDVE